MKELQTIIFSKDRAFQLDACIKSLLHFSSDKYDILVLYKTTTELYDSQYKLLAQTYPTVSFVREIENRLINQTIEIMMGSKYVLFVVDDTLFYREFSLSDALEFLDDSDNSLGFSLRLGKNTTFCHVANHEQKSPYFKYLLKNVMLFSWINQEHDFGYPLEVSSSIYATSGIILFLKPYLNKEKADPSFIESKIHNCRNKIAKVKPNLLCFVNSVAFSCPVNLTKRGKGHFGREKRYSINELSDLFEKGVRFDLSKLNGLTVKGCHQEIELI